MNLLKRTLTSFAIGFLLAVFWSIISTITGSPPVNPLDILSAGAAGAMLMGQFMHDTAKP